MMKSNACMVLFLKTAPSGASSRTTASAGVALLPFTSSTFAKYSDNQLAGQFFILNIIAVVAAYAAYIEYANRRLTPHVSLSCIAVSRCNVSVFVLRPA